MNRAEIAFLEPMLGGLFEPVAQALEEADCHLTDALAGWLTPEEAEELRGRLREAEAGLTAAQRREAALEALHASGARNPGLLLRMLEPVGEDEAALSARIAQLRATDPYLFDAEGPWTGNAPAPTANARSVNDEIRRAAGR